MKIILSKKTFPLLFILLLIIFFSSGSNFQFQGSLKKEFQVDTIRNIIRFESIKNKKIIIWPTEEIWNDSEKFNELKNYFGFWGVVIKPYRNFINRAVSAGFDSSEITALYWGVNYTKNVYGLGAVYADETDNNFYKKKLLDYSPDSVRQTFQNLKMNSPVTKFIIGTFKRLRDSSANRIIANEFQSEYMPYSDFITYTDYYCNCPNLINQEDQRPAWKEMKDMFGDKFSMVWIGAHKDTLDYSSLFEEANLLGINEVGFYQYQDPNSDFSNIEKFCEIAWQKGWLKKIEEVFIIEN